MLVKVVAHSPAETSRNNLCSGAVGSQENAGGSGMLQVGLADAGDFSLLTVPVQGCRSDTPPYLVPWFNQDLDWLTGLFTEVEIRYEHFINL